MWLLLHALDSCFWCHSPSMWWWFNCALGAIILIWLELVCVYATRCLWWVMVVQAPNTRCPPTPSQAPQGEGSVYWKVFLFFCRGGFSLLKLFDWRDLVSVGICPPGTKWLWYGNYWCKMQCHYNVNFLKNSQKKKKIPIAPLLGKIWDISWRHTLICLGHRSDVCSVIYWSTL